MTFLYEKDFSNQELVREATTDTTNCLFDLNCRSGRCLGLVSYIFAPGSEIGSFDQMVAQFGQIQDAMNFMQDERARLELLGPLRELDVKADDTICILFPSFPMQIGRDNSVSAACTIRDELFVVRIMIRVATTGNDMKISTIEKFVRKAVDKLQALKVVP